MLMLGKAHASMALHSLNRII